ncbi:MAG: prepilin peptidase [Nanoarchaeota archaeon]|nr:prepilin peptidase [Nanoarchaeota archaeon]
MIEAIILWALALVWILFAVVQDIKTREIYNWLNFSLIIFAIGFRFFYSFFFLNGFNFLYQGLIFGIFFFILGEIFYYSKMFAGGDGKLFFALGTVIPLNASFFANLELVGLFILIFLIVGFLYGFIATLYFAIKNLSRFKKEFSRQFNKSKIFVYSLLGISILLVALSFLGYPFWILGVICFFLSYLYLLAKSVDESCMVKKFNVSMLTEGDWLYKDVKVGKKIVKATWDGLTKKEIYLLKKRNKDVLVRVGVQFSPAFLISFVILFLGLLVDKVDFLWKAFW